MIMNPIPFQHYSHHHTYGLTFLESVVIKLRYDGGNGSYDSFKRFVEGSFGAKVSIERYNLINVDPVRLKNADRSVIIKLLSGGMEICISGGGYRNYNESARPVLSLFERYLMEIGASVTQLSVEMIDVWPFTVDRVVDIKAAAKVFFSSSILKEIGYDNLLEIPGKEFKDEKNNDLVIVKYGFIRGEQDNPHQPDRLILDSIALHDDGFLPSSLTQIAKRLNDLLYDAFHWAVSQEVLNVMRKHDAHEEN